MGSIAYQLERFAFGTAFIFLFKICFNNKPPNKVRNASKNTIKKVMRRSYRALVLRECKLHNLTPGREWNAADDDNYFLYNKVGAQIYRMSKGEICNMEPKGYERYITNESKK